MHSVHTTTGDNALSAGSSSGPGSYRAPEEFPRRILLAVAGLSPQVITETLYALAIASDTPFVPTEIHVLTTTEGAKRARLLLLDAKSGHFARLCSDYGLDDQQIIFDDTHYPRDERP